MEVKASSEWEDMLLAMRSRHESGIDVKVSM
jgi:hypothetical protein